MNLVYTFGGLVENNRDPLKLGRLKVRVPHVFGATGSGSGFVSTTDLPWAMPAGMPAGGSSKSGGFSQIPDIGDKVWVRFLDGEPEKPIWEWGMQSANDANVLKLHTYEETPTGVVGQPDRTVWTRNQHAIEMNLGGIIESTSGGYRMIFNDSTLPLSFDGSIKISTALGNSLEFDDTTDTVTLNATNDVNFQILNGFFGLSFDFTWNTAAGDFTANSGGRIAFTSAEDFEINTASALLVDVLQNASIGSGTTFDLTAGTAMTLNYATLLLGTGATEPMVLGNQLMAFFNLMLTYLSTHTHGNGNNGSPTAPPLIPAEAVLLPQVPGLTSKTAFVR